MFKKIVSNLPFSPTLISELGFYAKRLKKEEATRRLGLILTAVALVVQSFVVFSPPESANAANSGDLVHGGIHTRSQLFAAWDNNTQGYRDLLRHAGITDRTALSKLKDGEINTRTNSKDNGWLTWNRVSRGGAKYNETAMTVGTQTIYVRSLAAFDVKNTKGSGSWYPAWVGVNSRGEQFAIMKGCANITMKKRPPSDRNMQVCDIASRKIVTIRESQFNSSKYSKNTSDCAAKPISVCNLATSKIITIDERDFDTKKHSKNPDDCKPKPAPVATCSSLVVKKISRTEVELQAAASVANGATIKSYTYVIRDKDNKEVLRRTVATTGSTSSLKHSIETEGTYTVEVIVSTSLGDRKADGCNGSFTVAPIERCPLNPGLPINDPDCQPCPGDPTLWVKDENCAAKVIRKKNAKNLTANVEAEKVTANASDRIEYTLTATNEGKADVTFDITDDLSDILEYAGLSDRGGGTFNEQTKILSWKDVTLKPGEQQKRTYVVQLASKISPMSRGTSDPSSYDCRIINTFGDTIEVDVNCPAPKVVEQVVPELPKTGPTENLIIGGIFAAIVTFLYLRSRQMNKEVRLIRREVTAGTI